jgi:hypothetical protein
MKIRLVGIELFHGDRQTDMTKLIFAFHNFWMRLQTWLFLRSVNTTVFCALLLTLILLTWRIGWAPGNASKWQMGFNLAFTGLRSLIIASSHSGYFIYRHLKHYNLCTFPREYRIFRRIVTNVKMISNYFSTDFEVGKLDESFLWPQPEN